MVDIDIAQVTFNNLNDIATKNKHKIATRIIEKQSYYEKKLFM